MKENYCVYMHTLLVDGRKYIGITRQDPKKRWRNGKGYERNEYFTNTINKYGWNSFKHEILFEDLSKESACLKERALIKLFNTTNHNFGFNLTTGGEHCEFSKQTIQKIVTAHTIILPEEALYYQYIELNNSQEECAKHFNCTRTTLRKNLLYYNIVKERYKGKPLNISYDDLYYQYVELDKTQEECSNYFGCQRMAIGKYLKKYDINKYGKGIKLDILYNELYHQYIELDKTIKECAEYFNTNSTGAIYRYLKKYSIKKDITRKIDSREELYNQYITLNKTKKECMEYFNCSRGAIDYYIKKYKLKKDL